MRKSIVWAGLVSSFVAFATPARAELQCIGLAADAPAIAGLYVDNFGGWQSVGKEARIMPDGSSQLIFHICTVDNAKHFLIAQNSPGNDFNPLKFSRFEWTEQNGQLFFCQQVFDAASSADAADLAKTPAADPSDANDKGCGMDGKFPWSQLTLIKK
jgi:hypothetical protein